MKICRFLELLLKVVGLLLKSEVDINKPNDEGKTPLYVATQNEHLKIVELLLENSADVNKI